MLVQQEAMEHLSGGYFHQHLVFPAAGRCLWNLAKINECIIIFHISLYQTERSFFRVSFEEEVVQDCLCIILAWRLLK